MLPAVGGWMQPARGIRMHRENEKSNLVVVCRLVLRAFIEDAMGSGRRMIEGETQLIADLLVVLEKVLCHGFKGGKSILSMRSTDEELWRALKRMTSDRKDMTETVTCVDQQEQLVTPISRIRCLLRLVMMQKKIMDLFHTLVNSPYTKDAYESWSLLRSEEADQLVGSLLGLSVVDCSLIIEFDHLQEQPSSVDLAVYIKSRDDGETKEDEGEEKRQRRLLMEQNGYLEERNRQLQSNLENMKAKILEKERKLDIGNGNGVSMRSLERSLEVAVVDKEAMEDREREAKDRDLKKEEDWNKERNLLHTKIAQKEDEITYHKQKVEDIKILNKDLYDNLRSTEEAAKRRERELVATNQHIAEERDDLLDRLEIAELQLRDKINKGEEANILNEQFEDKCEQYTKTIGMLEKKQKELKEARDSIEELKRWKESARDELDTLRPIKEENVRIRGELEETNGRMEELEKTLEEMGGKLSESQLQVLDLKEELIPSAPWEDDGGVHSCRVCRGGFTLTNRKHHCRRCGFIFCKSCSSGRVRMASLPNPVRVCDGCMDHLKANLNKNL
ncbi:hypothetical protein PFISCL1PPCAC_15200 [Pristionchus fissidentatus]|uniref:FYVE-type domain-containing protein n=1 Tax=Pristionchus fissidentatus TaxID=1538716 RepID=A0AAV5VZR2_9BILA|nr:hypothetical protein PFISCL1PPCAC_15200 [Pristionchus fissidentatus]